MMLLNDRTKLLAGRIHAIVKTVVLIPIWLVVMPVQRNHIFRYYSWKIADMHRSPFSKAAYVFSLICWLLLVATFILLRL